MHDLCLSLSLHKYFVMMTIWTREIYVFFLCAFKINNIQILLFQRHCYGNFAFQMYYKNEKNEKKNMLKKKHPPKHPQSSYNVAWQFVKFKIWWKLWIFHQQSLIIHTLVQRKKREMPQRRFSEDGKKWIKKKIYVAKTRGK